MVSGFNFQPPRYGNQSPVPRPQQGVWGPPDMADMLMKGISGILPAAGSAYKGVSEQMGREEFARLARENPSLALQQVGQQYGGNAGTNTLAGSGSGAPGPKLPSMAQGGSVSPSIGAIDPVAQGLTPQQAGLLNGISTGESAGKYNIRYTPKGGAVFDLNGVHPGIVEQGPAGGSTAAGRYQFTKSTWDQVTGGNVPFTPENQDRYAIVLAQRDYRARTGRDLDTDLANEGFSPRIQAALSPTWHALKGNHGRNAAAFNATLERAGSGGMQMPPGTQGAAPASAPAGAPAQGPIGRAMAPENNRPIPQPTWEEQGRVPAAAPPAPPGPAAGAALQQQGNNPGQGRVQVASADPNFVPAMPALTPQPQDAQAAGQVVAAQAQHTQAQNAPGPSSRSFMGLPATAFQPPQGQPPVPGPPGAGIPPQAQPPDARVLPPEAAAPPGAPQYPGQTGAPVTVPPPTAGQPPAAPPPPQEAPPAPAATQPAPAADVPATTAQPAQGPLPPQVQRMAQQNPFYGQLLAAAAMSGDPALVQAAYGLATNEGKQKQYQFIESNGVIYQGDPYGGGVTPVAGTVGGAGYEIIKPTDTARRAQLGIDPKDNRLYQMNRKDGKLEHITPEQMKDNPQFSQEMQLSNQFEGLKPVQGYRQMEDAVLGLRSAFEQGNAQGDMLAVVGLFKTIDPTSTVSGAETANAQNSGGVPATLRNLYNKAVGNGQQFSPEIRAQFWNAAQAYLQSRQGGVRRLADDWTATAKNNGLKPENVVRWRPWEFKAADKTTFPDKAPPGGGGEAPQDPNVLTAPDGSTFRRNND